MMSLAAIPAYLIARRMLSKQLAFAAAVLAVAIPSMVYTGTLMTENAFYPIFLFAVYVIVRLAREADGDDDALGRRADRRSRT